MSSAKRYLLIALTFILAVTVFALVAPRTVHAITATLVQVVNSYANPVPTVRADDPGRNPVRLHSPINITNATIVDDLLVDATNNAYSVPPGKRLVLESVSVGAFPPPGQKVYAQVYAGGNYAAIPPILVGTYGSYDFFENTLPIRLYVEPGQGVTFSLWRSSSTGSMSYRMDVTGYLVDCTNGGGC